MRCILVIALALTFGQLGDPARSQQAPQADDEVAQFTAAVLALDPRAEESEARFEALVRQFVPASGPVEAFLEFMKASGFTCPWEHSLAPEVTRERPSYTCKLDVSPTAPSLSSVEKTEIFYVTANCDADRKIAAVDANVFHGLTGP